MIRYMEEEHKDLCKTVKPGRRRFFNALIYKQRFTTERTFAWIDKFKRLLIRFERRDAYFLGAHYIVFSLIKFQLYSQRSQIRAFVDGRSTGLDGEARARVFASISENMM